MEQTERNVLFVSDLPLNTILPDLYQFFGVFSEKILLINLNPKREHHLNLTARVIFKDYESANYARTELNLRKLKGHAIRLMWDERDSSIRHNVQTNLFIKNIPFKVSPREVYEFFSKFGDISSAKLNEDNYGNHIGYGYVTYYSPENAQNAINCCNGKEVWGNRLEVTYFQRMTERLASSGPSANRIYISNLPGNFNKNDVISLCEVYGEILNCNMNNDSFGKVYATVSFSTQESARKAQGALNKKSILGYPLICEFYQLKVPLKPKSMQMGYNIQNSMRNEIYNTRTNLLIKNIPYTAKEEDLRKTFEKYGNIISLKIEMYNLMTKIGNDIKEIPTSKGFGYVCFESEESAARAKEEQNFKYLEGFESWKCPIEIEYFIPKSQRNVMQFQTGNPMMIPLMGPQMGQYHPGMPPQMVPNTIPGPFQRPSFHSSGCKDVVDENYLKSLDNIQEKKEYLGEKIFKLIENHPLAQEKELTVDQIGKITGMIINIDDISEILDTCRSENILTSRINEALELINQN